MQSIRMNKNREFVKNIIMEALKNPKIALAWTTKGKHGRRRPRET